MPSVRRTDDALVREAAELAAHESERLVLQPVGRPLALGEQGGDFHADRVAVAFGGDARDSRDAKRCAVEAEVRWPHDFPLRQDDAAGQLRQIFAEGCLQDEPVEVRERIRGVEPLRPAQHFAKACDISRNPGESVGGELVTLQRGRVGSAGGLHARRDAAARFVQVGPGRVERFVEKGNRKCHGNG